MSLIVFSLKDFCWSLSCQFYIIPVVHKHLIAKRKAFWGAFFYTSKTLYLIFILSENCCMQVSYPFSVTLTVHYCLIVQRGDFGGEFFMSWIDGLWFSFSKKILHFGVLTILSHSCSQSLFNNTKGSIGGIFFLEKHGLWLQLP